MIGSITSVFGRISALLDSNILNSNLLRQYASVIEFQDNYDNFLT